MRFIIRRLILLLFSVFIPLGVNAVVVENLYQGSYAIEDQTAASLKLGIREAFKQVLVKVSGSSSSIENPIIQQELDKADSYVSSFSYNFDDKQSQLYVQASFSERGVTSVLSQAGENIWGATRPLLLLLVAIESEPGDRNYITENGDVGRLLLSEMRGRGVPVMYPVWDLQDEINLPVSNLWGQFDTDIAKLSRRYETDGYLTGRISQVESKWVYEGAITHANARLYIQENAPSLEQLISKVVDKLAGRLAAKYSLKTQTDALSSKEIIIQGVESFTQYRALQDYLINHHAISSVTLLNVKQDKLVLEIGLSDSWERTWQVLSLDKHLLPSGIPNSFYWRS